MEEQQNSEDQQDLEEQANLIHTYELTVLFSPDLSEMDLAKAITKLKESITTKKGDIKKEHSWGKKRLAYFINKADFASYYTFVFTIPRSNVNEIIGELELSADILRHMNLSLEKEGIKIEDLLTPEKEAAMIAASMREKMDPKTANLKKDSKRTSSPTTATSDKTTKPATKKEVKPEKEKLSSEEQEKKRKDLDKKLTELLKDKE